MDGRGLQDPSGRLWSRVALQSRRIRRHAHPGDLLCPGSPESDGRPRSTLLDQKST